MVPTQVSAVLLTTHTTTCVKCSFQFFVVLLLVFLKNVIVDNTLYVQ